jgi:hypothetical protein
VACIGNSTGFHHFQNTARLALKDCHELNDFHEHEDARASKLQADLTEFNSCAQSLLGAMMNTPNMARYVIEMRKKPGEQMEIGEKELIELFKSQIKLVMVSSKILLSITGSSVF